MEPSENQLEIFNDFQAILLKQLHERLERIRLNYNWVFECICGDMAKLQAAANCYTTQDVLIVNQLQHDLETEMQDYIEPIMDEYNQKIWNLLIWFTSQPDAISSTTEYQESSSGKDKR
jgi:hypothetical protein